MTYLLDTNVVSELVRRKPAAAVLRWLDQAPYESIHASVLTAGELRKGVERLPDGTRNTLSDRDSFYARLYVPGAVYAGSQTAASPLTVGLAVTDATPAGIVAFYDQPTGGSVVTQATIPVDQTATALQDGGLAHLRRTSARASPQAHARGVYAG